MESESDFPVRNKTIFRSKVRTFFRSNFWSAFKTWLGYMAIMGFCGFCGIVIFVLPYLTLGWVGAVGMWVLLALITTLDDRRNNVRL